MAATSEYRKPISQFLAISVLSHFFDPNQKEAGQEDKGPDFLITENSCHMSTNHFNSSNRTKKSSIGALYHLEFIEVTPLGNFNTTGKKSLSIKNQTLTRQKSATPAISTTSNLFLYIHGDQPFSTTLPIHSC